MRHRVIGIGLAAAFLLALPMARAGEAPAQAG